MEATHKGKINTTTKANDGSAVRDGFIKDPITGVLFYHYKRRTGLLNKPCAVDVAFRSRTLKFVSVIKNKGWSNELFWLNKELANGSLTPPEVCIILYCFNIIKVENLDVNSLTKSVSYAMLDGLPTKAIRFLFSNRGYNYLISRETDLEVITSLIDKGITNNKAFLRLKSELPGTLKQFYAQNALVQAAIAFCVDILSLKTFLNLYGKFTNTKV